MRPAGAFRACGWGDGGFTAPLLMITMIIIIIIIIIILVMVIAPPSPDDDDDDDDGYRHYHPGLPARKKRSGTGLESS